MHGWIKSVILALVVFAILYVVISPLPEYESMGGVLRIARSRDQFIEMVGDALRESGSDKANARQQAVRDGTWDARAERVSELIEDALRSVLPA